MERRSSLIWTIVGIVVAFGIGIGLGVNAEDNSIKERAKEEERILKEHPPASPCVDSMIRIAEDDWLPLMCMPGAEIQISRTVLVENVFHEEDKKLLFAVCKCKR